MRTVLQSSQADTSGFTLSLRTPWHLSVLRSTLSLIGLLNELLKDFSNSDSSASAFALRLQNYQLQLLPR